MMMKVLLVNLLTEIIIKDLGYVDIFPQRGDSVFVKERYWRVQSVLHDYTEREIRIFLYMD
jgi:hypothetical protein